jgi:hypothetical protein
VAQLHANAHARAPGACTSNNKEFPYLGVAEPQGGLDALADPVALVTACHVHVFLRVTQGTKHPSHLQITEQIIHRYVMCTYGVRFLYRLLIVAVCATHHAERLAVGLLERLYHPSQSHLGTPGKVVQVAAQTTSTASTPCHQTPKLNNLAK